MSYECKACGNLIEPFMSFGRQPPAASLRSPDDTAPEYLFDLQPAFCPTCHLFQIVEQPAPEVMFHAAYPYFTGTSRVMADHFRGLADSLRSRWLAEVADPFVVEIGSNDGTLLSNFAAAGIRHLGIEPSASVAEAARARGCTVQETFFGTETARQVRAKHGAADVIVGANVIAHIPAINEIGAGVAALLKDTGVFVFEVVYLGDVIRNIAFDQIYDEHVFTYSAGAVQTVFGRHGLELIDVTHLPTIHGGSMRYTLAPRGSRPVGAAVDACIADETAQGLSQPATYAAFRANCEGIRADLRALLGQLKGKGARIAGYGATGKSATLLNYCGITSQDLEFIQDSTPIKQGKLTPGTHIPIRSPAYFAENMPDYALLLAWNHRTEIEAKEQVFRARGGKWILYVPRVETA
jgi:methylation protein EvaC